jgi:hypothetical protein
LRRHRQAAQKTLIELGRSHVEIAPRMAKDVVRPPS